MSGLAELAWESVGPTAVPHEHQGEATLREQLASSAMLRDLLDRAKTADEPVLLLVNDAHRDTQTVLALEALAGAVSWREAPARFRALVATGTHRFTDRERHEFEAATLGGTGLRIEHVAWHDATDDSGLAEVGGVRVNRHLASARFVIPIGSVEPHYFAGITGAHKTVTIGCLAREAIERNHAGAMEPSSDLLCLRGNPVFDGIVEAFQGISGAGKRIVAINQVVRGGTMVASAVGDPLDTLDRLAPVVRRVFLHEILEPVDVLHVRVPPPLGRSLYQADKALKNNHRAVRDGGGIILDAECAEGVGADAFLGILRRANTYAAARRIVTREGYRLGDHKAVKLRHLTDPSARNVRVALVSPNLDREIGRIASIEVCPTIESAGEWLRRTVTGPLRQGLVVEDAGVVGVHVARA